MESTPRDLEDLCARVRAGDRPKYVFFWGHQSRRNGAVGPECFSQWYPAPFELDGARFASAEHYMMWSKAKLFDDDASATAILSANNPGAAKALGRAVRGFSDERWNTHRFDIVVRASIGKFSQNAALGAYLVGTHPRVLVEASPVDTIWGIGLDAKDEKASDPLTWRGENLLGF